jgi:hypothetical protein
MNQFSIAPPFTDAKNKSVMKATVNLVRMLSAKQLKRYTIAFLFLFLKINIHGVVVGNNNNRHRHLMCPFAPVCRWKSTNKTNNCWGNLHSVLAFEAIRSN